jgi:hypothetical protein
VAVSLLISPSVKISQSTLSRHNQWRRLHFDHHDSLTMLEVVGKKSTPQGVFISHLLRLYTCNFSLTPLGGVDCSFVTRLILLSVGADLLALDCQIQRRGGDLAIP